MVRMKHILCLSVLNIAFSLGAQSNFGVLETGEFDLELVQVLFRHGDRTPCEEEVYKNDPYRSIYPYIGYGELTQIGKTRMDRFGRHLRDLYGDFIGENGTDKIYAYYSGSSRTETSLRMVLAGLLSKWSTFSGGDKYGLPLALHNDSMEMKFLMGGMKGKCSLEYWGMVLDKLNSSFQLENKGSKDFDINRIANLTGAKASPIGMTLLYYNLNAVRHMKFPLPEWCSNSDYFNLKNAAKLFSGSLTPNEWTKRITAGKLLQQFLKNMENSGGDKKKLYLYSAHDIQLATLAQTLNFTNFPELADFGSSITIEKLRKKSDGQQYVRMTMRTGEQSREKPERVEFLKLQDCDFNCPFERFSAIVRPLFPTDEDWKCVQEA